MFSYFAKILKSSKYQSVLKVYFITKNRRKWAIWIKIGKYQMIENQSIIFFWLLLFYYTCTGSGYKILIVNFRFTISIYFVGI